MTPAPAGSRMEAPKHIRKVVTLDALLAQLADHRTQGRTVVQCHGCFDIVHPGHIRHLEFASRQGDLLVVTLTGDATIQKGDQRPYIPEELRAESLAALEFVNYVFVDPSPTAESILSAIQPNVYVKGREYESSRDPRFLAERAIVESAGGRVIFSSGDVVFSSTQLISRLPRQLKLEADRLTLICRRHGVDRDAMDELLERMSGLRVGVVGDIVLDHYIFCDAMDVASEAPTLSLNQLDEQRYLGGAAIVARHASALGARSVLLSVGAVNKHTDNTLSVLNDEGVEFQPLATRPEFVEKTRYLVEEHKLLKVERAQAQPLDSLAEKKAAALLESRSRELDAVIFCDFGYGSVTAGLLQRVLPSLRANVPILAADVSGTRGNLLNFRTVDLICPTEREVRNTLHDFEDGLSSIAWKLMSQTQARHLICTLGKRGLVAFERPSQERSSPKWSDRLHSEHLPSFAGHCLDRLGCGDALLAAATMALASGATLMQAAYLGNAAAAIEISRLGNHPVSTDDLSNWTTSRHELTPAGIAAEPANKPELAPTA